MNLLHARGDEPHISVAYPMHGRHLPHARGNEPLNDDNVMRKLGICPTHVGMNRMLTNWKMPRKVSAPRTWG